MLAHYGLAALPLITCSGQELTWNSAHLMQVEISHCLYLEHAEYRHVARPVATRALSSTKPSAHCMALATRFSVASRKEGKGLGVTLL